MLTALFSTVLRLVFTCAAMALRLTLALASLVGRLLGHLIALLWRSWRNRHAGKVPLRAAKQFDGGAAERPALPPPTSSIVAFTPRPLRPRPKR